MAINDNIAVAGVPMMAGCHALEGYVPDFDAIVVTRILDEGKNSNRLLVGQKVVEFGKHFCNWTENRLCNVLSCITEQ